MASIAQDHNKKHIQQCLVLSKKNWKAKAHTHIHMHCIYICKYIRKYKHTYALYIYIHIYTHTYYSVCIYICMEQNVYSLKPRFPLLAACFLLFSHLKTKRSKISKAVGSRIVILLTGGGLEIAKKLLNWVSRHFFSMYGRFWSYFPIWKPQGRWNSRTVGSRMVILLISWGLQIAKNAKNHLN